MIAQTPFTLTCLLNSQTESIAGSLAPFSGNLQRVLPGVRLETDDCRAQLQHGVCVCVCACDEREEFLSCTQKCFWQEKVSF